jgi:integrase
VQPAGRLSLPRREKAEIVPLSVAQMRAWADCADPRIRPMILTQAGLGLRVSELRALRVEDVDFLRRVVHVTAQLHPLTAERLPLKTANSRRDVPLPAMVAGVLAGCIQPGHRGLVFTRNGSSHWGNAVLWAKYIQAADAAGLPAGTTSHDLRHPYASVLLDAGESVHAVAARIGDSPEMVLRVYGHMMPDTEDATRRAVDAAWRVPGTVAQRG